MWYAIFALATALAALYEIFIPAIKQVRIENPECNVAQNPVLSLISLTLFAAMWAPVVFIPCVVPSYSERFRNALVNGLQVSS